MTYRLGITDDALSADGTSVHGNLHLDELSRHGIEWSLVAAHPSTPDDLEGLDAVYSLGHRRFGREELRAAPQLRHIARFGAGFDTIDLAACSDAGVAVTNTPEAIRRPLALAGLTMVLAVTHNLVQKHTMTVNSRWQDRGPWRGKHTQGGKVAIVGFGGVGADLAGLLVACGFQVVGVNRRGFSEDAERLGVSMVTLDDALTADVVVLCAALTSETRGMIGPDELARMSPDAALVNIGRGALVDQSALTEALQSADGIRAAALDVFDPEPPHASDPLLHLPNVTLSPHALCWTESYTAAVVAAANADIVAAAQGTRPENLLNPEALTHPKWAKGGHP